MQVSILVRFLNFIHTPMKHNISTHLYLLITVSWTFNAAVKPRWRQPTTTYKYIKHQSNDPRTIYAIIIQKNSHVIVMKASIVVRSMNFVCMHLQITYYPCHKLKLYFAINLHSTGPVVLKFWRESNLPVNHIPYPLRIHQWQSVNNNNNDLFYSRRIEYKIPTSQRIGLTLFL